MSVRAGDIVKVEDGLAYFGQVLRRDGRELVVEEIGGARGIRRVKPRDVGEHWRKVRPRAPRAVTPEREAIPA